MAQVDLLVAPRSTPAATVMASGSGGRRDCRARGALLKGEPVDSSRPSIFEALQKQLGLNLERQKGPVDVMVIDYVEKAVEN